MHELKIGDFVVVSSILFDKLLIGIVESTDSPLYPIVVNIIKGYKISLCEFECSKLNSNLVKILYEK